ncbi:MAG: nuclear transport factor 2 family protein [Nitrospiraceae bacterium]
MQTVVERFKQAYNQLNAQSLGLLNELYSDDVRFQDPFRRITGLPALMGYCAELYRHVQSSSFSFEDDVVQGNSAVLTWTMSLKHPRLNGGDVVTVPGSTHIRFRDKVFYHRDYFDGAAMLYENLPLIGLIIRAIKARV